MNCFCNSGFITPGETFTHIWTVPFYPWIVKKAYVTYTQSTEVMTVECDSFTASENGAEFRIRFSQADSLKFRPKEKAKAVVNLITANDARITSCEVPFYVGKQTKGEVL